MELQDLIYQHLSKQMDERLITSDKTEKYFAEDDNYQNCVRDIQERLKIKLRTGKCSSILVQQLAKHRCNLGEAFGEKIEFYNSSELLDLIELLENQKLEGDSFSGSILCGFDKIHHGSYAGNGYSIVRNIQEFWFKNKRIRQNQLSDYQEILDKYDEQNIPAIMNEMHTKAMRTKSLNGDLKGEWLIYKRLNNLNYYLCLATHDEGDANIYHCKLESCLLEFPELN